MYKRKISIALNNQHIAKRKVRITTRYADIAYSFHHDIHSLQNVEDCIVYCYFDFVKTILDKRNLVSHLNRYYLQSDETQ